MMKYKIQKNKIIENATKFVMGEITNKKAREKRKKFLENGGAFNGWTPQYMIDRSLNVSAKTHK